MGEFGFGRAQLRGLLNSLHHVQETGDAPTQRDISNHYTHGDLVAAIRGGIEFLGRPIISLTVDDLAPVDEFHIGGRQASEDFLGQLDLSPEKHVLDVGCGLGGAARFVASRYRCKRQELISLPNTSRPQGSSAGGSGWTTAFHCIKAARFQCPSPTARSIAHTCCMSA